MNQRSFVPGLLLIGLGAFLLLAQTTDIGGEAIVAVIGTGLLVAYAFTRHYGFLVPGSIMTGLGLGIVWVTRAPAEGGVVLIGLGLGFGLICLVDLVMKHTPAPWWPLIPGAILTTIGVLVESGREGLLAEATWVWPAVLMAIGAVIVLTQVMRRPDRPSHPTEEVGQG